MAALSDHPPDGDAPERARGTGAVRRPERTDAILDAAYELLSEVGYDRLTIDAVAARAHASKSTIYQRWPGKRELVIASFQRPGRAALAFEPAEASLPADLVAFLQRLREVSGADDGRAFLSLLAASQQDPVIGAALRENLIDPRRTCRQILERAVERGEIVAADLRTVDRILVLVMGQVMAHQLVLAAPFDDEFLLDLVHNVLLPVLHEHVTEDAYG